MTDPTVTRENEVPYGHVFLRGKLWEFVDLQWCGVEPDVGIMSDYVDGFDLQDADGNLWDWDKDQLTAEEDKLVNNALSLLIHEPEYDDTWDGDEDRNYDPYDAAGESRFGLPGGGKSL